MELIFESFKLPSIIEIDITLVFVLGTLIVGVRLFVRICCVSHVCIVLVWLVLLSLFLASFFINVTLPFHLLGLCLWYVFWIVVRLLVEDEQVLAIG